MQYRVAWKSHKNCSAGSKRFSRKSAAEQFAANLNKRHPDIDHWVEEKKGIFSPWRRSEKGE
jgi:hypothetical protein